jgi:hypothetical protein
MGPPRRPARPTTLARELACFVSEIAPTGLNANDQPVRGGCASHEVRDRAMSTHQIGGALDPKTRVSGAAHRPS